MMVYVLTDSSGVQRVMVLVMMADGWCLELMLGDDAGGNDYAWCTVNNDSRWSLLILDVNV